MTIEELNNIAVTFRKAILNAKKNRQFSYNDRMCDFPLGCCDDSCDLLGYYLSYEYGIYTVQGNGIFRDNNPENTTNHAWLITDKSIVIDITIDQFLYNFSNGIYVGESIPFYHNLENVKSFDNYNITQSDRLWNDYQIIIENIQQN